MKGQNKNEIIDWETAKQYSIQVMEYFGSRTIWTQMKNIIDPELHEDFEENTEQETDIIKHANRPSTSQLDDCPNEIEFEK